MTFTLTSTDTHNQERIEFCSHSSNMENPRAVEVIRWVTDTRGNWYQIWRGFHFVGNARMIYRDRIKKGWFAV
jgi:hypothetical protein